MPSAVTLFLLVRLAHNMLEGAGEWSLKWSSYSKQLKTGKGDFWDYFQNAAAFNYLSCDLGPTTIAS